MGKIKQNKKNPLLQYFTKNLTVSTLERDEAPVEKTVSDVRLWE